MKLRQVPNGNHSLLMLSCQIFKFFSNLIFGTAPLVIINNFNSLVIALTTPLMLLFGHIQGQQLTGYLLAGYLFITSSYVSLLTPLLGATGLHMILLLLAFITFTKSSVRVQTVQQVRNRTHIERNRGHESDLKNQRLITCHMWRFKHLFSSMHQNYCLSHF